MVVSLTSKQLLTNSDSAQDADVAVCDNRSINQQSISALPFLTVGTAVSAKYRGAFCEATVDHVDLKCRLRVQLKSNKSFVSIDETHLISGDPFVNNEVVIRLPNCSSQVNAKHYHAIVIRVTDTSVYTVVFDDGDKRTLRRTQLVIKGERHFKESETLDCLPLTNPEQFRQPVIDQRRKYRSGEDGSALEDDLDDSEQLDESVSKISEPPSTRVVDTTANSSVHDADYDNKKKSSQRNTTFLLDDVAKDCSIDASMETTIQSVDGNVELEQLDGLLKQLSLPYLRLLGRLVLIDVPLGGANHKDSIIGSPSSSTLNKSSTDTSTRRRFAPAIVVLPSAMPSIDLIHSSSSRTSKIPTFLVRSFKDNRFFAVALNHLKRLKRPSAVSLAHAHPTLRLAFERALLWLDRYELPISWGGEQAMHSILGYKNWRTVKKRCKFVVSQDSVLPPMSSCTSSSNDESTKVASATKSKKLTRRGITKAHSTPRRNFRLKKFKKDDLKLSAIDGEDADDADDDDDDEEVGNAVEKVKLTSGKRTSKRILNGAKFGVDSTADDDDDGDASSVNSTHVVETTLSSISSSLSDSSSLSSATMSTAVTPVSTTTSTDEDDGSSSSSTNSSSVSSEAGFEARDLWIAKLYRFMDERGTPINKAPSLANKDLDLYRLNKLVHKLGGFQRVTSQMKWGYVYSKMDLPQNFTSGPRNLQTAFKKYLFPLDDITRKLGTTLVELPLSRPRYQTAIGGQLTTSVVTATSTTTTTSSTTRMSVESVGDAKTADLAVDLVKQSAAADKRDDAVDADGQTDKKSGAAVEAKKAIKDEQVKKVATQKSSRRIENKTKSHDSKSVNEESVRTLKSLKNTTPTTTTTTTTMTVATSTPCANTTNDEKMSNKSATVPATTAALSLINQISILDLDDFSNELVNRVIPIGSRIRVRCDRVTYEAKVIKHLRPQPSLPALIATSDKRSANVSSFSPLKPPVNWSTGTELQYRVHYMGWNNRHDEVVPRSRIISVIEWGRKLDENRPPSCSSLNVIVKEPSRKRTNNDSTSARPNDVTKDGDSVKNGGCHQSSGKDFKKESCHHDDETEDDEDDDDGGDSDQSRTTETASDNITTTAPIVRKRRLMFSTNSTKANLRSAKTAGGPCRRLMYRSLKPIVSSGRPSKRVAAAATHMIASACKIGRLDRRSKAGGDALSVGVKADLGPQDVDPTDCRSESDDNSAHDLDTKSKYVTNRRTRPSSIECPSNSSTTTTPPTAATTPDSVARVESTTKSKKVKLEEGGGDDVHKKMLKSEDTADDSSTRNRHGKESSTVVKVGSRKVGERDKDKLKRALKRSASCLSNKSASARGQKNAKLSRTSSIRKQPLAKSKTRPIARSKLTSRTKATPIAAATTANGESSCLSSLSSSSSSSPASSPSDNNCSKSRDIDDDDDDDDDDDGWKDKEKVDGAVNFQAAKDDDKRKLKNVKEPKQSAKLKTSTKSHGLKADASKRASANSTSADIKPDSKTLESISKTSRSYDDSCTAPAGATVSVVQQQDDRDDESLDDEDDESSDNGSFGPSDALPRLTRSQHRQLLGDTPPGSALKMASSAVVGTKSSSTATRPKAKVAKAGESGDEQIDERHDDSLNRECSSLSSISDNPPVIHLIDSTTPTAAISTPHSFLTDDRSSLKSPNRHCPTPDPDVPQLEPIKMSDTELDVSHNESFPTLGSPCANLPTDSSSPLHHPILNDIGGLVDKTAVGIGSTGMKSRDSDDDDDEEEDRSSVRTMSTDPMSGHLFDIGLLMERASATGSSMSSEGDSDEDKNRKRKNKQKKGVCFKQVKAIDTDIGDGAKKPTAAHSDASEAESVSKGADSEYHHVEADADEDGDDYDEGGGAGAGEEDDDLASQFKERGRKSHKRMRRLSANSGSTETSKKDSKRASLTPRRSVETDQSPLSCLDSPHTPGSPLRMPHVALSSPNISAAGSNALASSTKPLSASRSAVRRFGGPFFPISGYNEMSSEVRCQLLQERMHQILESWRLAKQYLKELDHKAHRIRRVRQRQVMTTSSDACGQQAKHFSTDDHQASSYIG